ncbi:STAS domain-containing protein [Streptomyces sp. H62]
MAKDNATGTEDAMQAGQLSVTTSTTNGVRVLTVAGEIDHHTGDTLRQALDLTGTPRIVVNMRQVTFMDSSGINLFIAAHHSLTEAGGWLRLADVGDAVLRPLQLVGLDDFLDLRDTVEAAFAN